MIRVAQVISGCQTGADLGGLLAAEALGIPTGGTCPKGCRTEAGDRPDLISRFNLTESTSRDYTVRTYENIRNSSGTLIVGSVDEGGTALTYKSCLVWEMPYLLLAGDDYLQPHSVAVLRQWLARLGGDRILNVAGNRESRNKGIQQRTFDLLIEALR